MRERTEEMAQRPALDVTIPNAKQHRKQHYVYPRRLPIPNAKWVNEGPEATQDTALPSLPL
jgi:hypothetical protein